MNELRIRNWDKWQSYRKDRGQPPWIKIHRRLMRNPEWVSLTDAQRGQLVAIWLLAGDRDGVIPASPILLKKLCFMDSEPDVKLLIEKEFIDPPPDGCHLDAALASDWRQDDQPKAEESREDKRREEGRAALRADAIASPDIRTVLFNKGLKTLEKITGKTPDSCRSLVGKWLKLVNDEAIHVIGFIEDAERNRIANPVAWISKSLQNHQNNGGNFNGKRTVHAAAADLLDRVRALDEPAPSELRDGAGESPIRRLPAR